MSKLDLNGPIFPPFAERQAYADDARQCIIGTVEKLSEQSTTNEHPGMLLGKIQSGKTRTFLGVIALAFDNGFDVAIVFTKGTRALVQQTLARLNSEFRQELDADLMHVFDIMALPEPLAEYELQHKLVIVCKKEDDNIRRLDAALFHTNQELGTRRTLIVDDEADFASIGFRRTREQGIQMNRIAAQIDELRQRLSSASFLQVTATPYSLYLQPETPVVPDTHEVFLPTKPAFTELVPVHDRYIGGEYYFEESLEEESVASFLHVPVTPQELEILRERDRRRFKLEDCLVSDAVRSLRRSVVTFIVGGWIRRWQDEQARATPRKFSFIVHTDTRRPAHEWQEEIAHEIISQLKSAVRTGKALVRTLITEAYDDLAQSVRVIEGRLPPLEQVIGGFGTALTMVNTSRVNCDRDILALLDESGQLKLRTPFNIFIGGQILDRGLTIANLVGFFYGRSPNRFQQDTVLQHSRMYGVRPEDDLAVTRFYTTVDIYNAMRTIHTFDSALREAFERGGHDAGVVFLRADPQRRVIPCSPNKILLSTVTTVRPSDRFLPVGFSTDKKSRAMRHIDAIDRLVRSAAGTDPEAPFLLDLDVAEEIVKHIDASLVADPGQSWNGTAFVAIMTHLANTNPEELQRGQVACLVRGDRDLAKIRPSGRLQSAPDSRGEREIMEAFQRARPALFLFRQNGKRQAQWNGCPFWWPVLRAPSQGRTVIFASDTVN
jgi:hypothetical protein